MTRIAILISGNGSNLQAIIDAVDAGNLPGAEIALVVSNRREAYGIKRAIKHGIPLAYFPKLSYTKAGRPRSDYDADLARIVQGFGVEWVVQAGWMHIFTQSFIQHFPNRIVNLHPALPGMFPGRHSIEEAFEAYQQGNIEHTGVMIHLVPDEAVDAGPVVAQVEVPILPEDSLEDLETRIHGVEHTLMIDALRQLMGDKQSSDTWG
jgi:formyltetrahydrofolate-dependent phosphoribosylglycinamide formyltransferase